MFQKQALILMALLTSSCGSDISQQGDSTGDQSADYTTNSRDLHGTYTDLQAFDIKFKIDGKKNGNICVAVFDSESEYDKAEDLKYVPKLYFSDCFDQSIGEITIDLNPQKTYAIAAFHDLNKNGKLDTVGPLNIPKDGFGFSNYKKMLLAKPGRPAWKRVSFLASEYERMTIVMHYLL